MTEAKVGAGDQPQGRGIFDCEEAYRTPVRADYERVFETGMVVLDTNVLLNLYRSNERTRGDTFAVLGKLRDRLWVPHQVLTEFWRDRDLPSVRNHHRMKARDACAALDKAFRSVTDALDRWQKDVHFHTDESVTQSIDTKRAILANTLEDLRRIIQEQARNDALDGTATTHTDPVLIQLGHLLQGRVGEPYSQADLANLVEDAQRRAEQEIPPGYADFKSKPPERAAGDYVLWTQILEEAERRHCDALLVTGDVKEDWWVPRDGEVPARPRKELKVEFRQRVGAEIFMLTPSQLLTQADEIFSLKVDERSVSDLAKAEMNFAGEFPATLAHSIPHCIHRAHLRAKAAAEPFPDPGFTYGAAIPTAVLHELKEAVLSLGGTTCRLAGKDYPVLGNSVIYPIRYAKRPKSPDFALLHLKASRNRLFENREDGQESLFSSSDINHLGEIDPDWRVILVCFTSDMDNGVHAIYWGSVQYEPSGSLSWHFVEPLLEDSPRDNPPHSTTT
ncbi:PIN-like domain-containing protein [Streptomyces sp. NPDC050315]|uniref:PIN-like domain-containing protein n=1 Tax=Streptomyces sp. NPDC050315 TaxID=3155039 RepID=UPI00341DC355